MLLALRERLDAFAHVMAKACAHPFALAVALGLVLAWLVCGPWFGWSDTYSLVNNTLTGDVSFLLLFVVLATGARREAAMQLKLDELLRAVDQARNQVIGAELQPMQAIEAEAKRVHDQA